MKAREYWIVTAIIYIIVGTLAHLIGLAILHVSDVDTIKFLGTINIALQWLIWFGIRLWFLLNIRDWRDYLRDEKPKTNMHAPVVVVQMQQ